MLWVWLIVGLEKFPFGDIGITNFEGRHKRLGKVLLPKNFGAI